MQNMFWAKKLVSFETLLYYVDGCSNVLNSMGFIIGLSGALAGLVMLIVLPLVLVVIILLYTKVFQHDCG